ncbi:myb-related transcription factor, partner of profilin-like [Ambystoma mexicanum]|uniref:myb-related transcription factor, partner of profilin-like n=1 Tax=Ambystoma mexicanum TaxID=8296 RepID=UPI0037E75529
MRKPRFSDEELNMLADIMVEHADVMFCPDLRHVAQIRKKNIWEEVVQKVSTVGTTPRTFKDCRKHWDDLQLHIRSILSANRSQAQGTGGGASSPIKLARWEETCSSVIDMEAIEGVGHSEMGVPSSADDSTGSNSEAEHTATPKKPTPRLSRGTDDASRPSKSRASQRHTTAPQPQPPSQKGAQAGEPDERLAPTPRQEPQQQHTGAIKEPMAKGTSATKVTSRKTSVPQHTPQVDEERSPVGSDVEGPQSTATSDLGEAAQSVQHSVEEE